MTIGVKFINGNRIITIDNKTDMLVVRNNYSVVNMLSNGYVLMPIVEDEIVGFQLNSSDYLINMSSRMIGIENEMTAPQLISIKDASLASRNVRFRTLAKSSKMGPSSAKYGMRIWDTNVSPRKLIFDLGHQLFQPKWPNSTNTLRWRVSWASTMVLKGTWRPIIRPPAIT